MINHKANGGQIRISYKSLDQLEEICRLGAFVILAIYGRIEAWSIEASAWQSCPPARRDARSAEWLPASGLFHEEGTADHVLKAHQQ